MSNEITARSIAWHNSPPGQLLNRIEDLIFMMKLRYKRRNNGVPLARASAALAAQAEEMLRRWQARLLVHGREIAELRAAGVSESRIASLYPGDVPLLEVAVDFEALAARPRLDRALRRVSWRRLALGSRVVPTYAPDFNAVDMRRHLDLPWTAAKRPSPAELLPFLLLTLAKSTRTDHEFNLGLRHLRYLLRFAARIEPLLTQAA